MSMTRLAVMLAFLFGGVAVAACGGSDYSGGGRRTDLGRSSDQGIAITVGGDGNTSGNGGGAGVSDAVPSAGNAGCAASGDTGQSGGSPCGTASNQ